MNKTIEQGYPPDDGRKVTENIFNTTFEGITGNVTINENGDRLTNSLVYMVQNGSLVKIAEWISSEGKMKKTYKPNDPNDWSGLIWPGNVTTIPSDTPACGWKNELCTPKKQDVSFFISGTVAVMVVLAAFLAFYLFRKHR